jgi:hypothetical protein
MGDFPPFALIVDSGELESCVAVLASLERDWLRASARDLAGLVWPTELLISTAAAVPRLAAVPPAQRRDALWLCAIEPQAGPVELERLRTAGVHFVVRRAEDGSLDQELLRLLFLQLAYTGAERRGCQRMLCWHEVSYVFEGKRTYARLLDLSEAGCRVLAEYSLSRGSEVQLYLPRELDPQAPRPYTAVAVRSSPAMREERGRVVNLTNLIFEFDVTKAERAALAYVLATQAKNPRVQKLNPVSRVPLSELEEDRRASNRRRYGRRVAALTYFSPDAPQLVRGREISGSGMRIEPTGELSVGQTATLALHRGRGRPPLRLKARVARDDGEGGLWLQFKDLTPALTGELDALLEELPSLESIATAPPTGALPGSGTTLCLAAVEPWFTPRSGKRGSEEP